MRLNYFSSFLEPNRPSKSYTAYLSQYNNLYVVLRPQISIWYYKMYSFDKNMLIQ